MAVSFEALMIYRARLQRNWSQEGLCKGICSVSYLSKIEKGKASPRHEVLALLMKRLQISWQSDEEAVQAQALANQLYEAVFSMDEKAMSCLLEELSKKREDYLNGPYMLDFLLLEQHVSEATNELLPAFEAVFNERQGILWRLQNGCFDELLRIAPSALVYCLAGQANYQAGCYAQAQERLTHGYELAAAEGRVYVMLRCKLMLGNCYSDQGEAAMMGKHYEVAARLAEAVGDICALDGIKYNGAATAMQSGCFETAYSFFMDMGKPSAMGYHKLAICCEKLGKHKEALCALQQAEATLTDYPNHEWVVRLCAPVRYRLQHSNYLNDEAYGSMLLTLFQCIREELPNGYAVFHLPWVQEWYTANRKYKQAYELLCEFSDKHRKTRL